MHFSSYYQNLDKERFRQTEVWTQMVLDKQRTEMDSCRFFFLKIDNSTFFESFFESWGVHINPCQEDMWTITKMTAKCTL